MNSRDIWYIIVNSNDGQKQGIGEIAPINNLSCDAVPGLEDKIAEVCRDISNYKYWIDEGLSDFPSIRFGLETAMLEFESKERGILFPSDFTNGNKSISINGLIWMGELDFMLQQIREKIQQGFNCIKLKIGALDFDHELQLIQSIRKEYPREEIEIRVDANGAFSPEEAPAKLEKLAAFQVHSIEQPIRQKQWESMAELCMHSSIPIALDEELIGLNRRVEKIKMLLAILPDFIILKPSLHGGIAGCREWIEIAESLKIGWWITSALESNIGLNAIAQWTATLENTMHQGLGTGQLFANNIFSPLEIKSGKLHYLTSRNWDLSLFE